MKVKTSRFGELTVNPADQITFSEGLLGFENLKKYFVVDPGDSTLILWLQSLENEKIAFPIVEPKIFKPDYVAKLLPADLNGLDLDSLQAARVYSILTIPANLAEMSANLKAPVVINSTKQVGKQIVLADSKLSVKHEMYMDLKKSIANFSAGKNTFDQVQGNSLSLETGELKTSKDHFNRLASEI